MHENETNGSDVKEEVFALTRASFREALNRALRVSDERDAPLIRPARRPVWPDVVGIRWGDSGCLCVMFSSVLPLPQWSPLLLVGITLATSCHIVETVRETRLQSKRYPCT